MSNIWMRLIYNVLIDIKVSFLYQHLSETLALLEGIKTIDSFVLLAHYISFKGRHQIL